MLRPLIFTPLNFTRPDFDLKPNKEKFPSGAYHDFIQYTVSKNLVANMSNQFPDFNVEGVLSDSQARELLIKILGQPLKMLKKKMDGMRTSWGRIPQLVFCYYPPGGVFTSESERLFWGDLCREEGVAFVDLCDDFAVIGMTYYPFSVSMHFTNNGMNLFTNILLYELAKNKFIPAMAPGL
jgi:hypothetical protein